MTRNELLAKWSGKRIPVLDHGGIELLDVMGLDYAVVQSARVSFGWEIRQYAEAITDTVLRKLLGSHDLLAHPDSKLAFERARLVGRKRDEFIAKFGLDYGPGSVK